jgi:pyruvate/2-oxoglutarate dehydrogenase complex dihydrolipoamide dehydrogenase (E3) component
MKSYDAIVIGSGQAGPSMASALAERGQRVAIAEGYRFGGSCVNYGCRPTKVLIASARAAHMARRGADFGVMIDGFSISWEKVRQRVVGIIEETSGSTEGWLRGLEGVDVYHAYAHFDGKAGENYRIRMGDEVVEAPRVFLNTGTRARVPDIPGIESVTALDSEGLLRLEVLPEHLLIYGGSYIALEMGQAFRRLGSRVTIIETAECIINREDDDVQEVVHGFLTDEGVTIHTKSSITRAEPGANGGVRLYVRRDGENTTEQVIQGSHWLNAIGRVPNTDKLNLESVGVQVDGRGNVVVDDGLATTAPGIWALGDINGKGAFTHTSYHDYEIVRDNLLHGRQRKVSERIMAYNLYTDPPLGHVGMSEKDARKTGREVLMAVKPMRSIGRAVEQAETTGFIKLLVDAESEKFLGATVLGFHGDEVIQVISYYMATGATTHAMREALPIHPTIAEFLPTVLSELKPL